MVDPRYANLLRISFKYLNKFMLLMWRLDLGWFINIWPSRLGRILVLTHTGRKSGIQRRTPVNYAIVNGDIYVTAGFGHIADWYRNIKKTPQVEVWLPDGWWAGAAEEVTDHPDYIFLMRQVLIGSGFAGYLAGLDAKNMSDEALLKATETYKLLRIRRTEAKTGPGGPGEWGWVWPVLTVLLLPGVLRRGRLADK